MPKIIGIANLYFTPKDSETPVEGSTIYITNPIPAQRGTGSSAEHFFLSKAKLAALDFTPAVGMEVEVLYNRFGKVGTLRLLDAFVDIE